MLNPDQVRAKMAIPPQLKAQYAKFLAAGMKVLFSDETNNLIMQQLQASPDIVKNIADGIAGLMAILFNRSNKTMPQQLIVPLAIDLMSQVIDFVTKTKFAQLSPQQVAQTTQATLHAVLTKFGVDPQKAMVQIAQAAKAHQASGGAPGGLVQGGMR